MPRVTEASTKKSSAFLRGSKKDDKRSLYDSSSKASEHSYK